MSLCMAFYNAHGIIMSADNMITATISENDTPYTYQSSNTEQKIFLIENKYGLSYSGTSRIDSIPVSAFLENYIASNSISDTCPNDWLIALAYKCNKLLESWKNIVFILAGYHNSERFVITTNTQHPEIKFCKNSDGLLYSGENEFLSLLINSKVISFEFEKFTLQDAANFLRFLNRTVSGLMHFGQYLPTVSESCDVLAILPNRSHWLAHSSLH